MLIEVGERELLRDDSIRLARRALAHNVKATINLWPGVFHAWQMAYAFLPEGRQSLEQAAAFLHQTRTNANSTIRMTHAKPGIPESLKETMAADLTEA